MTAMDQFCFAPVYVFGTLFTINVFNGVSKD